MNRIIDMHIHTTYSDGELTPSEILNLVKETNVKVFSLTDHDSVSGNKKLLETFNENDIKFITGVEITAYSEKGELHILGYDLDINNVALNDYSKKMKEDAILKVKAMVEALKNDYNIIIPSDELDKLYKETRYIGRPDLARLMVKYGFVDTFDEAFVKYLRTVYKYAKEIGFFLKEDEVIKLILAAGGIPVLAHPLFCEKNDLELEEFIVKLKGLGLMGIECFHCQQPLIYQKKMYDLAIKHNLLYSGGSDFHGINTKPDVKLGTGINNNIHLEELSLVNYINNR